MKVVHIADLHLGKSLSGQSLERDQRDWMEKFVALVKEERPAAVLIAGDVYDRAAPNDDAVKLLDDFLAKLLAVDGRLSVLMVAGNHDSGRKLAFGAGIFRKHRLHIAGEANAEIERVVLEDEHGPVTFWLLPFTFPARIQQVLGEETPRDYSSAIQALLARQGIDVRERNVLVAHQAVTWDGREADFGGSETVIGGVGNVDGAVFGGFDYVALGHIHRAQAVGRETIRYAGSPLCYHFDEAKYGDKGAVCVTLGAKGAVEVGVRPIPPLHRVREVRGTYEGILAEEGAGCAPNEYVKVVLTDRYLTPEVSETIRALFVGKGSLALAVTSEYAVSASAGGGGGARPERTLDEKFTAFWQDRHAGVAPDEEELRLIRKAAELVTSRESSVEADAEALVKFALEER